MLDHPLSAVVSEASLHIAQCIANFGQIAARVKPVGCQRFNGLILEYTLNAFDAPRPLRRIDQRHPQNIEGVAQLDQPPVSVVIQINAVVVSVAPLCEAQASRVCQRRLEQPVHAVFAFDQQLAVAMTPHRQPFTRTKCGAAQRN